jgi:PAS domain S-box-containing protein
MCQHGLHPARRTLESPLIIARTNDTATHETMHPTAVDRKASRLAPQTEWRPLHESEHVVQFYETDTFLLHALTDFIGTGLASDDACIVVATPAHRIELEERLQAAGLDVASARASGQYVTVDAAETLAMFMVDESPDPDCFATVIGQVIAGASAYHPHVRIFGEMVALLWAERQHHAALQLERLWNDLHARHTFVLFCAYPMRGFGGDALAQPLIEVCAAHTRVIPAESYTALTNTDERLRTIIQLQQQAHTLQAEIAERKATEERLRASEQRYRRLFETSTDGILIVDAATHTIIDANPSMIALLGFTPAELFGKELWNIGLFASRSAYLDAFRALHEHHIIHHEHVSFRTRDGQQRVVEFVGTLDQANGQQVFQCNLRDITKRTQAEELLRRREQELTDFFENATIGLHWVASDGSILWANRAELELLGYPQEEYFGHHIAEFHADPHVMSDILARLKRGEELHDYEARLQCKDGSIRFVLISSNVHWEDGRFIHTRCFTRDITERKQAEQEREQLLARERAARVEAQEAVRVRDIFLSIAAHELKTPLTSLLGNAQLLQRRAERDGNATDRGRNALRVIVEQAKRLNKMILALLDVSRIETGKLSIERAPMDLCALVRRVVEEVQPTLGSHTVDCQMPTGILMINGDEVRLEQVVQNLLSNAIKYSPSGGSVAVLVKQHNSQAHLEVSDVGMGIPKDEQPHLFQRFYRASNAESQFMSGMGIGLYVVKEIVTLHGGTIALESCEGVGSTFSVSLPIGLEHTAR